jgi:hypothetical protein
VQPSAAQIHCAIAADAVANAHPDEIEDPVLLSQLFQRWFLD